MQSVPRSIAYRSSDPPNPCSSYARSAKRARQQSRHGRTSPRPPKNATRCCASCWRCTSQSRRLEAIRIGAEPDDRRLVQGRLGEAAQTGPRDDRLRRVPRALPGSEWRPAVFGSGSAACFPRARTRAASRCGAVSDPTGRWKPPQWNGRNWLLVWPAACSAVHTHATGRAQVAELCQLRGA